MIYLIRENTNDSYPGFYVNKYDTVSDYSYDELVASSKTWINSGRPVSDKFRNHKTAREAISHLRQVVGKRLIRLDVIKYQIRYGYPVRYAYTDGDNNETMGGNHKKR